MFKSLPHRRFHRLPRREQQQQNPKLDTEQTNLSPPIISLTNLVEITRQFNHSPSNNENEFSIIESLNALTPVRSLPRRDTPIFRNKIPLITSTNVKQILVQRTTNQLPRPSLNPIGSNLVNQENSIQRAHQIIKRQIFLPFDKK